MRKITKSLTGLVAALLLFTQLSASAYEPDFWAEDAVKNATALSIISEQFAEKPFNLAISRNDFVNVAVNLYATLTSENVSTHSTQPFTDTSEPFPNMAYYAGIVSGDGEGHFFPQGTLTRQEMCKIITSLLDSAGVLGPYYPSENVFSDILDADQIAPWAKNHVAFMLDNHLMAGDDVGTFRPTDPVTRQEAAIIAYRCYVLYGKNLEGQIKTTLRETKDINGATICTLYKTITLPSGATVELRYADNPDAAGENNSWIADSATAPSGTPLQIKGADGLYRLKTYTETLSSGEAAEKAARIFPDGKYYTSQEEADANMTEVTVNVWMLNENNEKYASTLTFRINTALKDDIYAIFEEIFYSDDKPPIKNATAYAWRNAMSSGVYSDHNYGTAIDLNYNENYCVYKSGTTIGSFYDPESSVYSFPPDGTVIQTFTKYGWLWGGDAWINGTRDHMHFSYLGK
ncbi:MAG: S-layer homology domain-containing protein [Clostridia bacterium]|nr:S-layer homology domain-containing protein [Clostridia bacterium]